MNTNYCLRFRKRLRLQMLFNIPEIVKCTLHYDSTSRCKIDGDWPSIIFSFSNNRKSVLRPFFALKTRYKLLNSLLRLTSVWPFFLTGISEAPQQRVYGENINYNDRPSREEFSYWKKALQKELKSNHVPYHFLCKAHTVEVLDQSNINVLINLEHALKLTEALESMNSGVKWFLRG